MPGKNKSVLLLLFFCGLLLISAKRGSRIACKTPVPISVETKTVKSGNHYTIIYQEKSKAGFVIERPSRNDSSVVLCIAAAFTLLDDYTVDGLHIVNGEVMKKNKINKRVGGGVKIIGGKCTLLSTKKGKLINDSLITLIAGAKGSFFQQIMLIENGAVSSFKDTALFQRRAIVTMKNGATAVIESFEHIRLSRFSGDLAELGVKDAIYTDMGSWDEGWYRNPKNCKTETIGRLRAQTSKQTNWFIFSRR